MSKFLTCLFLCITIGWWLPSCRNTTNADSVKDTSVAKIPNKDSVVSTAGPQPDSIVIKSLNRQVLKAIKEANYQALSLLTHPVRGVRFSLSGFIDTARDPLFTPARLLEFATGNK